MNCNPDAYPTQSTGEDGFTLLELLIALTITAMIFTFGYGGLQTALRNWDQANARIASQESLLLTRQFLQDILENAHLFPSDRSERILVYPWVGEGEEVIFSAPLAANGANNALYRVKLWHQPDERALRIAWVADNNEIYDPEDESQYNEVILLDGIAALTLSYFERAEPGETQRWVSRWSRQNGLPAAVKLDIKFQNEKRPAWPTLIAIPHVTAPRACAFDPVSRLCRGGS